VRLAVACALSLPVLTVYVLDGAAAVVVARQVGWAFAVFTFGLLLGAGVYLIIQDASKDLEVGTLSWIFGVPGALAALLGIVLANVNVLPQ
jgi:hypothetical protein